MSNVVALKKTFPLTQSEVEIMTRTVEMFNEDSDVADAMEHWIRGNYSDREFHDRLEYLREEMRTRATREIEPDSLEPDDSQAKPGTWGRHE